MPINIYIFDIFVQLGLPRAFRIYIYIFLFNILTLSFNFVLHLHIITYFISDINCLREWNDNKWLIYENVKLVKSSCQRVEQKKYIYILCIEWFWSGSYFCTPYMMLCTIRSIMLFILCVENNWLVCLYKITTIHFFSQSFFCWRFLNLKIQISTWILWIALCWYRLRVLFSTLFYVYLL